MDESAADTKSSRRIAAQQRWLAEKLVEVRRSQFYGDLTVTLKFEAGQCVFTERLIREREK